MKTYTSNVFEKGLDNKPQFEELGEIRATGADRRYNRPGDITENDLRWEHKPRMPPRAYYNFNNNPGD